jgi:hypothetical protein
MLPSLVSLDNTVSIDGRKTTPRDTCTICQMVISRSHPSIRLTGETELCGHRFHPLCIQRWLYQDLRHSCPLCRNVVLDPSERTATAISRWIGDLERTVVRTNRELDEANQRLYAACVEDWSFWLRYLRRLPSRLSNPTADLRSYLVEMHDLVQTGLIERARFMDAISVLRPRSDLDRENIETIRNFMQHFFSSQLPDNY